MIILSVLGCTTEKKAKNNATSTTETNNTTAETMIENSKWILTKLEGDAIAVHKVNSQEIYFTLNSKTNRIHGNSGCNTFTGTYILEKGNSISFSQITSTKIMCSTTKINESKIVEIFNTANSFAVINGELALNNAKLTPLTTFKKATMNNQISIVEKHWKLKTLKGTEITMANQEREIYFMLKTGEKRVTGFTGCNSISGKYLLEKGNSIRFKNMATTLMLCPDLAVHESNLLKVFELADNYTVTNNMLSLNNGKRVPLGIFEAIYMK
ncbi:MULTISPECIES: META domain-containing protein [unclassified Polaribacter]|uniref:META domain-containing protein n=1 Tax=unclassified Polaribacter TaxID=196858 RepID=UPI001CB94C5E|nr:MULTISPECIES: META domain-containing protein [unclassified Polaribacter]